MGGGKLFNHSEFLNGFAVERTYPGPHCEEDFLVAFAYPCENYLVRVETLFNGIFHFVSADAVHSEPLSFHVRQKPRFAVGLYGVVDDDSVRLRCQNGCVYRAAKQRHVIIPDGGGHREEFLRIDNSLHFVYLLSLFPLRLLS